MNYKDDEMIYSIIHYMEKELAEVDYIVVGAGIFGAVVAERLASNNKKVLVIDRREHIAGNIYSEFDKETGIEVHKYGSHIFHTKSDEVWEYLNRFAEFNDYVHTVHTRHDGKLYPMPINLDTINLLYGTELDAKEAEEFVRNEARATGITEPKNFEEQGLFLVGRKLYDAFLKNYTAKQWGTDPKNLSADILKRIPVRFSKDARYFMDAKYQGIPKCGYTEMVRRILGSPLITVKLGIDFRNIKHVIGGKRVIYCGQIDELFDYELSVLPYRSLKFEEERTVNGLGEAVINEANVDVVYTRTHDYKYYQIHQPEVISQPVSIICREYPVEFKRGEEAYYPINNDESKRLYQGYVDLLRERYPNMVLGGRLGAYQYWDMDQAVERALELCKSL